MPRLSLWARAYIYVVAIIGIAIVGLLLYVGRGAVDDPTQLNRVGNTHLALFLLLAALLMELAYVRLSSGMSVTSSVVPTLAGAMVLPAGLAALIAMLVYCFAPIHSVQLRFHRRLFRVGELALAYGAASLAFHAVSNVQAGAIAGLPMAVFVAGLAAVAIASIVNLVLTVTAILLTTGMPLSMVVQRSIREAGGLYAIHLPFSVLLAYLILPRTVTALALASLTLVLILLYSRLGRSALVGQTWMRHSSPPIEPGLLARQSIDRVLQAVAEKGLEGSNSDMCVIFTIEGERGVLRAEAPGDTRIGAPSLDLSIGLFSRVVAAETPIRAGPDRDSLLLEPWLTLRGARSLAATSLKTRDTNIGMVVVARKDGQEYGRSELDGLLKLSYDVTLALANVDVVNRAQDLSALEQRLSLARDLHDRLAGDLATASALLKFYEQERTDSPPESSRTLQHIRSLVEGSLRDARDILSTLRPAKTQAGLRNALDQVASAVMDGFSTEVDIALSGDESQLPYEDQQIILQVAREALVNVRKHSAALRAQVRLVITGSRFELTIDDDGVGIDLAVAESQLGSFGIAGMRERAAMAGASIEVERLHTGGSRVTLVGRVPTNSGA